MKQNILSITLATIGAMATSVPSISATYASTEVTQMAKASLDQEEPVEVKKSPKKKRYVCKTCNSYEKKTLTFLQDNGITDKNALSTIMGNIRQESTFIPNICEGGSRRKYPNCGGGYGIIQWTNAPRFYGLGRRANQVGLNPSSIDAQLDYMLYEGDWKEIEPYMKTPGKTINYYMRLAKKWIRWGHHGARTQYAYNYTSKLSPVYF